jgi:8-amino-7-oxononanoate synthase
VSWCSNDYLGLSTHPALAEAASRAAATWGIGARASRLLAGTTSWHARLEEALAAWFGAEKAIVYPSGYLANLGTLGALLSSQDAVFVDRLAHASLFDAARASRATLRVFRHNDVSHVAALLSRAKRVRRRLIVTEGVFSMEGDCAPLTALIEVAEAHGAMVYVDDAHGAFVLGQTGRGSPESAGVLHERFLYMGTLGKGLGCQGGFVVGPGTLIDFLRNRARTFIYTTALAVPVVAAAVAALDLLRAEPQRRTLLQARVRRLQERLTVPSATPLSVSSHIVPVVVGQTQQALDLAGALWDRGLWVPAIRPPTVPEGSARLRLSISALHTEAHIDALAGALQEALWKRPLVCSQISP